MFLPSWVRNLKHNLRTLQANHCVLASNKMRGRQNGRRQDINLSCFTLGTQCSVFPGGLELYYISVDEKLVTYIFYWGLVHFFYLYFS